MRLDDSRARAMTSRFVRECEEDALNGIRKIHKSYKLRKKLTHYREYYTNIDKDAFLSNQIIGSNKYSMGVLSSLRCQTIKRDYELARGDFDEDMVFFTTFYVDHYRGCISVGISPTVNATFHAIQRVYQRTIAEKMKFHDSCIFKPEVLEEFKDVLKYAKLLSEALLPLENNQNLEVDPVLKEIAFPIPTRSGLFMCQYEVGSLLTIKTYLSDEQLSHHQLKMKNQMRQSFEAFFDSPLAVELPGDEEAAMVFAPQFQHHEVVSFLFYWFSRAFDWWELTQTYQSEVECKEIAKYHFFQRLQARDPLQGFSFKDGRKLDIALKKYLEMGHAAFFHSNYGQSFTQELSHGALQAGVA